MGDGADDAYDAYCDAVESHNEILCYYLSLSDKELKESCSWSRLPIVVSIRKWDKKLSEKQRWVLAQTAARLNDNEN